MKILSKFVWILPPALLLFAGCLKEIQKPDATGKMLATDTVYPHEPQKKWQEAQDK